MTDEPEINIVHVSVRERVLRVAFSEGSSDDYDVGSGARASNFRTVQFVTVLSTSNRIGPRAR